jgi:hypothetical protein
MRVRNLLWLALAATLLCQAPARAMSVEEAIKLSRESGRPLLIVAGRHTCGLTQGVLQNLESPALRPMLAPYVNVFADVDGAEGRACREKYGSPGNMLPYVYVVRADGEKLFSHSGMMELPEIREMLSAQAGKAGKNLTPKEKALLQKALDGAKRAQKSGDLAEAVRSLLPLKRLGPLGELPCYTSQGSEANKLVADLIEEGKKAFKEVEEGLADGAPTLEAVLAYVKARRTFAALPALKVEVGAAARKYDHRRDLADLLHQAEALDRAQVAAASGRDPKKAADAFRKIAATYPDTDTAKLAAAELKKLAGDDAEAGDDDAPKAGHRTWTDTAGHTLKARCRGVADGKVALESGDGRVVKVPLEKLSDADRKFLKSQEEKGKEKE